MEETLIPLVSEPPIPGTQPIPMTPDMGMSAYAQRKETAAKQKEIDDARALVDKSKKKVEKTVLAAAEKARVKGLTPEQKLNDPAYILKAAQSKEKKEKAQQLKDAEASKVAAATARVNAAT
jgi:phosphoribosylformylglycinamidine (FGAM) synthase-like enzyme